MKLYKKSYLLLMLMGLFVVSSCVRDDIADCPPLKVVISVKDKNYFNVDNVELEDRLAEDLPMRNYVPTLYWVLRDAATGEIVDESPLIDVKGDEQTYLANVDPNLQHGKYILTVWGGLDNLDPLGDDPTTIAFHPENMEGRDIYMTNDTLTYDAWHSDYVVELERTKGKLIIEKVNLPASVTGSEKSVSGLFAGVNTDFTYSGETFVVRHHDFEPASSIATKTLLTPSLQTDGSILDLTFLKQGRDNSDTPSPKKVKLTMRRNELTVLKFEWVPEKNDFLVYILIDDSWDLLNNLIIE